MNAEYAHTFDHIFADDTELEAFLERCAGPNSAGMKHDALDMPLPLQFLPSEGSQVMMDTAAILGSADPTSNVSSFDDISMNTAVQGAMAQQHLKALTSLNLGSSLVPPGLCMPPPMHPALMQAPVPPMRGGKVADNGKPQISHSTVEKQRRDRINSLIDELRELVPPSKATLAAAASASAKDAANSDARRPKHVVLSDTITLLKQLQIKQGPLTNLVSSSRNANAATGTAAQQAHLAAILKEEGHQSPSNSNSKGSVSSREDMESKDEARTAAPTLPNVRPQGGATPAAAAAATATPSLNLGQPEQASANQNNNNNNGMAAGAAAQLKGVSRQIPIAPTVLAGVHVERGPDCMYVQVLCRDRKGLLLDIINSLRLLPLEVRTAAVTTQPDGMVRDVFEVCVDDDNLQPADIQNLVHEALFQQYVVGDHHKRPRSQTGP